MADEPRKDHQVDGASAKIAGGALLAVLALVPLAVALVVAMFAIFNGRISRPAATDLERTPLQTPGPRLEAAPKQDRLALEGPERERLQGYGWVDRHAGIARIPIERAMALEAARGWPGAAEDER